MTTERAPTLYHFTAFHHLDGGPGHAGPGIFNAGLLANPHPLLGLPAHIWLTEDDSWQQFWSSRPVPLPGGGTCDRTEARLTVNMNTADRSRLMPYPAIRWAVRRDWREDFEGGHDLSAWWVYLGWVPVEWIEYPTGRDVPIAIGRRRVPA